MTVESLFRGIVNRFTEFGLSSVRQHSVGDSRTKFGADNLGHCGLLV